MIAFALFFLAASVSWTLGCLEEQYTVFNTFAAPDTKASISTFSGHVRLAGRTFSQDLLARLQSAAVGSVDDQSIVDVVATPYTAVRRITPEFAILAEKNLPTVSPASRPSLAFLPVLWSLFACDSVAAAGEECTAARLTLHPLPGGSVSLNTLLGDVLVDSNVPLQRMELKTQFGNIIANATIGSDQIGFATYVTATTSSVDSRFSDALRDLTIESTFHELSIHSATFHGILTVTRHPKDLTLFVSDTVAVLDGREATSFEVIMGSPGGDDRITIHTDAVSIAIVHGERNQRLKEVPFIDTANPSPTPVAGPTTASVDSPTAAPTPAAGPSPVVTPPPNPLPTPAPTPSPTPPPPTPKPTPVPTPAPIATCEFKSTTFSSGLMELDTNNGDSALAFTINGLPAAANIVSAVLFFTGEDLDHPGTEGTITINGQGSFVIPAKTANDNQVTNEQVNVTPSLLAPSTTVRFVKSATEARSYFKIGSVKLVLQARGCSGAPAPSPTPGSGACGNTGRQQKIHYLDATYENRKNWCLRCGIPTFSYAFTAYGDEHLAYDCKGRGGGSYAPDGTRHGKAHFNFKNVVRGQYDIWVESRHTTNRPAAGAKFVLSNPPFTKSISQRSSRDFTSDLFTTQCLSGDVTVTLDSNNGNSDSVISVTLTPK